MNIPIALLLLVIGVGLLGILVLMMRLRLHPVLALLIGSLLLGWSLGLEPPAILSAFQSGAGEFLGRVAMTVVLAAFLARLAAETGGAAWIGGALVRIAGPRRVLWLLLVLAFIIGPPLFFGIALILFLPVIAAVANRIQRPILVVGLPFAAALAVPFGMVPRFPGAAFGLEMVDADIGISITYGIIIGFVAVAVGAAGIGHYVCLSLRCETGELATILGAPEPRVRQRPGLGWSVAALIVPALLLTMSMVVDIVVIELRFLYPLDIGSPNPSPLYHAMSHLQPWTTLLGSPTVALVVAALLALHGLERHGALDRLRGMRHLRDTLRPMGELILLLGCSAGLGKVLDNAGVGGTLATWVVDLPLPLLVVGWGAAAASRFAIGSSAGAVSMALGLMAPAVAGTVGKEKELVVLAVGAGSLFCPHLNSASFWLVMELFNLSVGQTLRTWTLIQSLISLLGLGLVLLLSHYV